MSSAPGFRHPNSSKVFEVVCDASKYSIDGMLGKDTIYCFLVKSSTILGGLSTLHLKRSYMPSSYYLLHQELVVYCNNETLKY